ncbi:glycosyltransferase [Niallia circulans]|uniref:glycosyltransferase n=1 Tax=Niallia circulans TaxID=1397 RepID=UPI003D99A7EA
MKVVFAHDSRFIKNSDGKIYSSGSLGNKVWNRYLNVFDEIAVVSRMENIENSNLEIKNLNLSSNEKVSFYPIPNISSPKGLIFNKKLAEKLITKQIEKADGLIARLPSEIGNLAIKVAKKIKKPYLVEVVACPWDNLWNYGNIQGKVYAPYATYQMKKNVIDAPFSLYVTKENLQKKYPNNGRNIGCSDVEISMIEKSVIEKRVKNIKNGRNIMKIGLIGTLNNKIKGIDVAIKAIDEVVKYTDVEFHILGGGDNSQWVNYAKKFNLESKVFFDGKLPSGDPINNWLDDIDIYIQPSYQEGLPRALIEAMSRGCPCLASNVGGIPELLDERYLHNPGDYNKLSKQILKLCNDKDAMELCSKQSFTTSKEYYSDNLNKKRNDFYQEFFEFISMKAK